MKDITFVLLVVGIGSYYPWYIIVHGKDDISASPENTRRFFFAVLSLVIVFVLGYLKEKGLLF